MDDEILSEKDLETLARFAKKAWNTFFSMPHKSKAEAQSFQALAVLLDNVVKGVQRIKRVQRANVRKAEALRLIGKVPEPSAKIAENLPEN